MESLITVLVSIFVLSLFGKKFPIKPKNMSDNLPTNLPVLTEQDISAAFKQLAKKYTPEIAKAVEKMYRLETAHFKSLGFKNTYGAGALGYVNQPNYGWGNLDLKKYGVTGLWSYIVNGKKFDYLVFSSFPLALNFLADYLLRFSKNGDLKFGIQRWGSSQGYVEKVLRVTSKYN